MDSIDLKRSTCYFLGTFRNYWNISNKRIVFAHDLMTDENYSIGLEPEIPGKQLAKLEADELNDLETTFGKEDLIKYLYPERIPKEDRDAFMATPHGPYWEIDEAVNKSMYFYNKFDIIQWLRQKYALAERAQRFKACLKARYPKEEPEPRYRILDPQGAKDFPGIPIQQMQLPTPTAGAVPRPPPKQILIRLVIAFSVINLTNLNGYSLILNVEEVKG